SNKRKSMCVFFIFSMIPVLGFFPNSAVDFWKKSISFKIFMNSSKLNFICIRHGLLVDFASTNNKRLFVCFSSIKSILQIVNKYHARWNLIIVLSGNNN